MQPTSSRPQPTKPITPLRFLWRLLLAFVQIALLATLLLAAFTAWLYHEYGKNLPDPHEIGQHHPFETGYIYARDGTTLLYELRDPQGGHRTLVPLEQVPDILKQATIAVEDANFYQHPGVDMQGIIRALWLNYTHQDIVSGGSTITQQLVRAVLLSPEETRQDLPEHQQYERKMREAILAYRVSKHYTKDEILHLYLNEVYYGARAYGVEAAAQTYFNKHVWELSTNEATLLAGLPQSPSRFNPFTNMPQARERQRTTLSLMVKYGYLPPQEKHQTLSQTITLVTPTVQIQAPHFVFYVRDLLEERYGREVLYGSGLRITTSLDPHWQARAEAVAGQHIAALRERNAHNAAVVMLSPQGEILAMVGSVNYTDNSADGQYNVALAPRQPGSALKPIVYAAALQQGWTPATVIWDTPTSFDQGDWSYQPMNYDNRWHGAQRLRMALANSLNIPAVKALDFVGIDTFVELAQQMGITTFDDPARYGLSMALGSNEVRLLDLTATYNTFRNGGHYQHPNAILKVETSRGEMLEQHGDTLEPQVLGYHGEQIAYLINDILSDNEARWYMFGRGNVMELPDGRPAAVKTGTSNDWRDSWAIGYTPAVTIGAWVGNNDNSPMHEIAGSNGGGLIWRDLMIAYHEHQPIQPFPPPGGIVEQEICAVTGTQPHPTCPYIINEIFIRGKGPPPPNVTEQTFTVAGDGTCLAASYTPPDQVRQQTYTIYPPEFRAWAARSGIPQPPTQPCPPPQQPDKALAILTPISASGEISGTQIFINGTARHPYTLDVGHGAHPSAWNLLHRSGRGIENGLLGVWDTGGYPPGPYTIRLSVTTPEGMVVETTQAVWYK